MDEKANNSNLVTVEIQDSKTETVSGNSNHKSSTDNGVLMKVLTVVAVIALLGALWFALERRGVVSTDFFSMQTDKAVATVNGVAISRSDFDTSLKQREQMLQLQGLDANDAEIRNQLQTEVLDTLINGELLLQAAQSAGFSVDEAGVQARYDQIRDGLGGDQALQARMTEVGITESVLRRDIANDYLIQRYLEEKVDFSLVSVDEMEIAEAYEARGGEAAGLPPLAEVRDQVEAMVRSEKEQAQVASLLAELREVAEIKIHL
jgi:hypothetical protein